ncbi:MAG: glutathione S-transferase N-terminal domain-containing protein [Novosphingobium sp.]|nr:glutathione S-transferase N-terminal domain-containing protein [Novosphingobium sp.]
MKLHTYFRSSASFRVRIALALKQMDYSAEFVNLKAGEQKNEFARKNPQGLVPLLEDGDFALGQSLAIVEYLDEICPDPRLLPEAPKAKAVVRSMAQLIACDIHLTCPPRSGPFWELGFWLFTA